MKKAIIATIITIVIIALFGVATAEFYAETARVIEVNYDEDTVTVENFNGFTFVFEGCEDYAVGDGVSLVMETNGTDKIMDDVIISAQYCGWELVNWQRGE